MANGDPFKKKREKIKKELLDDAEVDKDSDHPVHEKYTKEEKFKKMEEE